jgi:magnesium transporter
MPANPPITDVGEVPRRRTALIRRRSDEIAAALGAAHDAKLRVLLESLRAADLGEMLEHLPEDDRARVIGLMDVRRGARVLKRARAPIAAAAIERIDPERAADLLDWMAVDDRASILELLPQSVQEDILALMEQRAAGEVRAQLAWPAESVGRLIQSNVVRLAPELAVGAAVESVREQQPAERTADLYVVDEHQRLVGQVTLSDLVFAPSDLTVRDVMSSDIITAQPTDDREKAARVISKYDLLALAVVDERGALLGVVTIDDILDVVDVEHGEDVLNLGAIETSPIAREPYFDLALGQIVRSRAGWLIVLFIGESLTGTVLQHFEHQLARVVALSFFIPLLIGTGGNAGSQTVTTVIRGLAVGEIRVRDWARVLAREAMTGLALGLLLGTVAVVRAVLWGQQMAVCVAVGVSILAICVWSNSVGAIVPLALQKLNVDPTVASAPLITTLVDGTGLFIYLTVASVVLGI